MSFIIMKSSFLRSLPWYFPLYPSLFYLSYYFFQSAFATYRPDRVEDEVFGRVAQEVLYHYHAMGQAVDMQVSHYTRFVTRLVLRWHNPEALTYEQLKAKVISASISKLPSISY